MKGKDILLRSKSVWYVWIKIFAFTLPICELSLYCHSKKVLFKFGIFVTIYFVKKIGQGFDTYWARINWCCIGQCVVTRLKIRRWLSAILGKILLNEKKCHYCQSYGSFCIFCKLIFRFTFQNTLDTISFDRSHWFWS